jgi:hydroxymethylbilane synthase
LRLRIATRGSQLALAQTGWVAEQLRRIHSGLLIEIVPVVTRGDRELERPLTEIGGKGLFVTEVEAAVQEGQADLAVHSLKDLPVELGQGLEIACFPPREDARDVLVTEDGRGLEALARGDAVGTNSLRRRVQLRSLRPDLAFAFLRGNIDSRIAKLKTGQYRAIVLAYAGLRRLGLDTRRLHAFSVEQVIPAVGQGALALEIRAHDRATRDLIAPLEDGDARATAEAERAFLHALGGDCNVPLAGHARIDRQTRRVRFDAMVGSTGSGPPAAVHLESPFPNQRQALAAEILELGQQAAAALLAQGAASLIEEARALRQVNRDPRSAPAPH